jgi:putative addiction module component (TIGR02574 family)
MALTIEQLEREALKLPASSRAVLAEKLVESLHGAEDADHRREWAEETQRRLEDVRMGRVEPIPGEQVFAEIRQMLAR